MKEKIKQHIINLHSIHETLKDGWQEYNLYFYIVGLSSLIGLFTHTAGITALILTFLFFYFAGRFHMAIKNKKKRIKG